jgi:hypothetical protein
LSEYKMHNKQVWQSPEWKNKELLTSEKIKFTIILVQIFKLHTGRCHLPCSSWKKLPFSVFLYFSVSPFSIPHVQTQSTKYAMCYKCFLWISLFPCHRVASEVRTHNATRSCNVHNESFIYDMFFNWSFLLFRF